MKEYLSIPVLMSTQRRFQVDDLLTSRFMSAKFTVHFEAISLFNNKTIKERSKFINAIG